VETTVEIPLFPLNIVLFPTTVLPLHIFEQRYRRMIADCLENERPFGIVLTRPESQYLHEVPYSIGTMARIHQIDQLEDGRYNLLALGTRRFRILSLNHEKPYLSGLVEPYNDAEESQSELEPYVARALDLFSSYLEVLLETDNRQHIKANLPTSPEELSYLIAYLLDMRDEEKQYLLELTSTRQRLAEESAILRREVPFVQQMLLRSDRLLEQPDRSMLN
jgi:Lon protease-like protein